MKSTVVDESLSTNATRVLFQRKTNSLVQEKGETLEVDFGINPEMLKSNYLDMSEEVHTEMVYTNRFDDNSDLSTT